MGTYCKTITQTGSGGTAGTYSSVGTITLRQDARKLRALIAIAACDKLTTIEGSGHVLRLTNIPQVGTEYFAFGDSYGSDVATNAGQGYGVHAEYIPLDIPVSGGEVITVEYSFGGPTSTENQDIAVGLLYEGPGGIPEPYNTAISLGAKSPARGGIFEDVDNATAAEVVFSAAGQNIPAWARAITNVLAYPLTDAVPTVDDPIIAKYRFTSTAPNFEPQEYPGCLGFAGALGTATAGQAAGPAFPYPVYVPLGPGTKNVTCYSIITVANAGNVAHIYNLRYI